MREFKYSAEQILHLIHTKKDAFWSRLRETQPLKLFHEAARRVPAYKDFLKKNRINPAKIRTFKDFQLVPPVSKKNYLRQYPLEKLCWDGTLKKSIVWTSTSGSTGEPFYFPRNEAIDEYSSVYHQMFLENDKDNRVKSTLVIVGFGMGVWVGGLITYQAFKKIASRGYPLSILTPGSNKKEIFEAIKHIGSKFDQVILCGYPPFIKDTIDEAVGHGINWSKLHIKIIFAAEAFSETFRDYVVKKAHIKNKYKEIMNIYGSADLGTMAEETPLSVLVREAALGDSKIYKNLFHEANRIPTLAQFNPLSINFDIVAGEVFCTGTNTLPLVRYAIGDRGGVLNYRQVMDVFKDDEFDLIKEARKEGIYETIHELPFMYVYERTDLSTKLYGAIIYAEHVRGALQHHHLENFLTGKFSMTTEHDKKQNEYLAINIELRPKVKSPLFLKKRVFDLIEEELLRKNAEYKYLFGLMPEKVRPKIVFWKHEHPLHFKPGIKQKWVKAR